MSRKKCSAQNPLCKRVFRPVFALFLVLGLLAFGGCDTDGEEPPPPAPLEADSPLIGTWEFTGAYGTEAYKITDDTIQYGNGAGTAFVSTFEAKIHEVAYHTGEKDSGILYIEYTTKKPQYYSYGPAPDYTQTGGPFDPSGDFTAVLFHELKTAAGVTTIKLCNPYKASDTHEAIGTDGSTTVRFTASEVGSLAAAKQKFTTDTESEYVAWSGVSAQTRVN